MNNLGKIRVSNGMIPVFWKAMPDTVNVLGSEDAPGDTTIFLCKSDLFDLLADKQDVPFYDAFFERDDFGNPKFLKVQKLA